MKHHAKVTRDQLLTLIETHIRSLVRKKPVVVAIDGPDCSGKTTLSINLLMRLKSDYAVQVFHGDDYINPIAQGFDVHNCRPDDFYEGFFDREAILRSVLHPLRKSKKSRVPLIDIAITEGLFLGRADFISFFDVFIRLHIDEDEVLRRALKRDTGILGDAEFVRNHYLNQAIPAQDIYAERNNIVDISDFILKTETEDSYVVIKQPV